MQLPERGAGGDELSTTMQEAQQAMGGKIAIRLILPDGSEPTHEFQTGQSIAYIKAVIMHEYGHAVASTVLKCNGTTLIDPMCLNDYPAIDPAAGAVFEVKA